MKVIMLNMKANVILNQNKFTFEQYTHKCFVLTKTFPKFRILWIVFCPISEPSFFSIIVDHNVNAQLISMLIVQLDYFLS